MCISYKWWHNPKRSAQQHNVHIIFDLMHHHISHHHHIMIIIRGMIITITTKTLTITIIILVLVIIINIIIVIIIITIIVMSMTNCAHLTTDPTSSIHYSQMEVGSRFRIPLIPLHLCKTISNNFHRACLIRHIKDMYTCTCRTSVPHRVLDFILTCSPFPSLLGYQRIDHIHPFLVVIRRRWAGYLQTYLVNNILYGFFVTTETHLVFPYIPWMKRNSHSSVISLHIWSSASSRSPKAMESA